MRKTVTVISSSVERPEAVEAGFAKLVGIDKRGILTAMEQTLDKERTMPKTLPKEMEQPQKR